jgi:sulfate transport system substrate-binding protein
METSDEMEVFEMKTLLSTKFNHRSWRLFGWLSLAVVLLVLVVYSVGQPVVAGIPRPVRLVVYAFSTMEEVFTQGVFPEFEAAWEAQTGGDLTIEGVFGPSGTLSGQITLGAPADVAVFSNAQHVTWLKYSRLVRKNTEPVVIGATPIVIVTRPGNPEGVEEFADLAGPGMQLLHPDPLSSGAGEWAVLAEYGSAFLETGDESKAEAQLQAIWSNVSLLAPSARAALTLFELGAGDALITYEQDARMALARSVPLEIVMPTRTITAQPVAVLVDANITRAKRPVAQAFIDYLLSAAGQQTLLGYQLRPDMNEYPDFPPLEQPFTVDDLGGWSSAHRELVENLWQTEIQPRLDVETAPALQYPGD